MNEQRLIIPNLQELTKEQKEELLTFLDSCPLEYEIWDLRELRNEEMS